MRHESEIDLRRRAEAGALRYLNRNRQSRPSVLARVRRVLLIGLAVILLACWFLAAAAWDALGAAPEGLRLARIEESPQWHDDGFENPLTERMGSIGVILRRTLEGNPHATPELPPPVVPRAAADFPAPEGTLAVTWLGHSTLIVEIDGVRVLTDPVFSLRASPWQFLGPKRFHRVPIAISDLPDIDVVLISHDHYDHLDHESILELSEREAAFLVPLGIGAHLEAWGVPADRIEELDWWQEVEREGVRFVCAPARHFSGRSLLDRNRTLWASWVLLGPEHRMYFSGDTAMFPGFAEIGEKHGPFDVTAIEVGAYDRNWADVHLGPEQAVAAHKALSGGLMLPVHWGTFDLAIHGWTEPVERLRAAARANDVAIAVPRVGERIDSREPPEVEMWWPRIPWQTAAQHPVVSSGL